MEEKKNGKPHSICWRARAQGNITGVTDVLSFDETTVVLETEQGHLTLKGKDLHIDRLLLEQGEVALTGRIDSLLYSGSQTGKRESLAKRLFR